MKSIIQELEAECGGYIKLDCAGFISDMAEGEEIPPSFITLVILKFLLNQTKERLEQEGHDTTRLKEFIDDYVKKDLTDILSGDISTQYLTQTAKGEC